MYSSKKLSRNEQKAYRGMMLSRLKLVNFSEVEFEELIQYSKERLIEEVPNEKLEKLLIVINKHDFMANYNLSIHEYAWLDKIFSISALKKQLIDGSPRKRSTRYYLEKLSSNASNRNLSFCLQFRPLTSRENNYKENINPNINKASTSQHKE